MTLPVSENTTQNPLQVQLNEEVPQAILQLQEEGQSFMSQKEYAQAAESFSRVLEQLSQMKCFQEEPLHLYLSPIWHAYGKALLACAAYSVGVLGEKGEEGVEKMAEKVVKEEQENGTEEKEGEVENSAVGTEVNDNKEEQNNEKENEETANAEEENNFDEEGDEEEEDEGEDVEEEDQKDYEAYMNAQEAATDFENAWEALETSRIIFYKYAAQIQPETPLQPNDLRIYLAEVHVSLAELKLEQEQFDEAVGEYQTVLQLKQQILAEDDRQLAEVYFRISMAFELKEDFLKAREQVQIAIELLEKRLFNLLNQKPNSDLKGKGKAISVPVNAADEIEEIKTLIPELKAKMKDLQASHEEKITLKAKEVEEDQKAMENINQQIGFKAQAASATAVHDLSSMVKKRKVEVVSATETDKKQKV